MASGGRRGTRQRLLECAFELFVQVGFDGTSISEVERRVGLTPGTGSFYHHFPSKLALLHEAVKHHVALVSAETDAAWADLALSSDPVEAAVAVAKQALADIRRFQPLRRLLTAEGDRVPGLRQSVAEALGTRSALADFVGDPDRFLGLAALMGYHSFSQESDLVLPDEDAFVRAVVARHGSLLPPQAHRGPTAWVSGAPGESSD